MSPRRVRFDWRQLRITRGALVVFGLQLGLSVVWLMSTPSVRTTIADWLVASPSHIFEEGKVWTLVTSPLLETNFISLIFTGFMMWMLIPTLERFWGLGRFYRFVAITSVLGVLGGCLVGLATGHDVAIHGLSPFIYASVVAFGVVYARQPVQFFGVLPLSGRQFMFGIVGFVLLWVVFQQFWEQGGSFAAAMIAAAVMTSKRWSPGLVWKRWRIARARAHLSVIEGGASKARSTRERKKADEQRWLN